MYKLGVPVYKIRCVFRTGSSESGLSIRFILLNWLQNRRTPQILAGKFIFTALQDKMSISTDVKIYSEKKLSTRQNWSHAMSIITSIITFSKKQYYIEQYILLLQAPRKKNG